MKTKYFLTIMMMAFVYAATSAADVVAQGAANPTVQSQTQQVSEEQAHH